MAIDYINIRPMSRSEGVNSLSASAYRANAKLYDEQLSKFFDYTNKGDCVYANIILPETAFNHGYNVSNHPFNNREKLWNTVELKENSHNRRDSARIAYEIQLALPKELSLKQNKKLVNEFIYDNYVSKFNIAADICIHDKNDGNPHAHVMLTPRSIINLDLSNKKARNILPNVKTNSKGLVFSQKDGIANKYRKYQNNFFKQNGINLVVDQNRINGHIHMRRSSLDGGFLEKDVEHNRQIDQYNLDRISKDHNIIIDILSRRQSTFNRGDIESLVLKCTVADQNKYQEVLDKIYNSKRLVDLGYCSYGRQTFTTKENYSRDIELTRLSNILAARKSISIETKSIGSIADKYTLSCEQKKAIEHISHQGNLSCVVGYAGTGKTYMLKAVNDLYTKKGYEVYGASISGKAVQSLGTDTQIKSRTIASLLFSYNNQRKNLPTTGSLLIIDEAGMVGLDDMLDLIKMSKDRDLKLILVGDPNQLEAMSRGNPFKHILDSFGFVSMKEVIRQKNELDRSASINLAESKIGPAIDHYSSKNKVHIIKADQVLGSLLSKYSEYARQGEINDTLVVSHTKKDVEKLNHSIRDLLVEQKNISLGSTIDIGIPKGKNDIEFKSKRFAVGEKLVFLKNAKLENGQLVKNGLFAKIIAIDKNMITVVSFEKEQSRELKIDTNKYNNFDYGYATTVHKSQGSTVENMLLFVNSKGWNKNLVYVGMSRHKSNLDLFINANAFSTINDLKKNLSSKSNKELNVSEFIKRKYPDNFFDKILQNFSFSEKYEIKSIVPEQDKKDLSFLSKIKVLEKQRIDYFKVASLLEDNMLYRHASKELISNAQEAKTRCTLCQGKIDSLLETFKNRKNDFSNSITKTSEYQKVLKIQRSRDASIKRNKEQEKSSNFGFSRCANLGYPVEGLCNAYLVCIPTINVSQG